MPRREEKQQAASGKQQVPEAERELDRRLAVAGSDVPWMP